MLAADHAEHVVAVDLNPRALWLTELNCRLNGIANVECRKGDLFEPVAGETFDLVVTNPPSSSRRHGTASSATVRSRTTACPEQR